MKYFAFLFISCVLFIFNLNNLNCESKSISLAEKEVECYTQNKVFHPESDKCYKLLTRGPCADGYWYVLEKPRRGPDGRYPALRITAVCVEEKCPEGGYYWPRTKTCVQPKDKKRLCGNSSDEELLNNVFGEAECMCARDPVRARLNGDERNKCYQLYTQGPCQRGEVLAIDNNDLDRGICIEDRCYEESIRRKRDGTLSRDGVLAPWNNGTCYELGTQGPCPDTLKFKVHAAILKPTCITLTNAIFDLEKPQKCYQDENGDCQQKINSSKTQNADRYKQELLSSLSAARKKRSSK